MHMCKCVSNTFAHFMARPEKEDGGCAIVSGTATTRQNRRSNRAFTA